MGVWVYWFQGNFRDGFKGLRDKKKCRLLWVLRLQFLFFWGGGVRVYVPKHVVGFNKKLRSSVRQAHPCRSGPNLP